jgi:hypothetical protein
MKITPGTWAVQKNSYDKNGCLEVKAMGDTPIALIAHHDIKGEENANANLIASSPKLLKQLEEFVKWTDYFFDFEKPVLDDKDMQFMKLKNEAKRLLEESKLV